MSFFKVTADFKAVSRKKDQLITFSRQVKDMRPLAERMKKIIVAGNRQGALEGVDKRQQAYAALRPSTIATRAGNGPPLAPRGGNSRVIKRFKCEYTINNNGQIVFTCGWVGSDMDWIKYHIRGYTHRSGTKVPARNPSGIRPRDMNELRSIGLKHFKDTARATIRTTQMG